MNWIEMQEGGGKGLAVVQSCSLRSEGLKVSGLKVSGEFAIAAVWLLL